MKTKQALIVAFLLAVLSLTQTYAAEKQTYWHNKQRELRYKPEGDNFVIVNGNKRFNRALYGTNTAFRVETGDLPEFALYMPGMGGNLKFGLVSGTKSKWLVNANKIIARYNAGIMSYEIEDELLGKGKLFIDVLAMGDAEGMIVKTTFTATPQNVNLIWAYGGATTTQKFNRDGDLNTDPESNFYLKPENSTTNAYVVNKNNFSLAYGGTPLQTLYERYYPDKATKTNFNAKVSKLAMIGAVPSGSDIKIVDAAQLETPLKLIESKGTTAPAVAGKVAVSNNKSLYFLIQNPATKKDLDYANAAQLFDAANKFRLQYATRIKVETPDPFINTLGGILGTAADANWEAPTFVHGAIGWRVRLNGWRGPYMGDELGWHDRAREHFNAYAKSQVTTPASGPSVPDPEKNLSRQQEKMGTALFTDGYICRDPNGKIYPHHYDMNLVYIDALLRHFNWTGDVTYVKEMWPVVKRHLAWEKRNFDGDNDGLYDAYCCIWASDALQYNGSGVTHSSAYNYYSNRMAAELAKIAGDNPEFYRAEAQKILDAMNSKLWLPSKGWYAEYKDFLGLKQTHNAAALWTVYHTLDSEVPDAFKAYQCTRYIDTEMPHIPVRAAGLEDKGYYTLSTTNWMPYEWSINNVVPAESFHTSLAYWQAGRSEEAFRIWKSTILDAMYLGGSPGNFLQLSTYDANRGETFRDFADCVGMASRSLVEGLFGIVPDLINSTLIIRPGLPVEWNNAALTTPDVAFKFVRNDNHEVYTIVPSLAKPVKLKFRATAKKSMVKSVTVNGKKINWTNVADAIEYPQIEITADVAPKYEVVIDWQGEDLSKVSNAAAVGKEDNLQATFGNAKAVEVFDPQKVFKNAILKDNALQSAVVGETGSRTAFVKVTQGDFTWWLPVCFDIKESVNVKYAFSQPANSIKFTVQNNTSAAIDAKVTVNPGNNSFSTNAKIAVGTASDEITVPASKVVTGSNLVRVEYGNGKSFEKTVINWNVETPKSQKLEKVDLSALFNDVVTNIFKNEYLSPRSPYPTLALPKQGIGTWCSPMKTANIDDSGLRNLAGVNNEITTPQNILFATPSASAQKNIIYTSQWDNYPREVSVPLKGQASHAYLLMAGSTNYMQSRIVNGTVTVEYTDGTVAELQLINPETWCPIEKDYYVDGYAFAISQPRPLRLNLKTGNFISDFSKSPADNSGGKVIDGGAATILDMPLNASKQLKRLTIRTLANEVVIGLMSLTLAR